MNLRLLAVAALALCAAAVANSAQAQAPYPYPYHHLPKHDRNARWRASLYPWHGAYYSVEYGQAVALVVPPTAELKTDYGWSVGNTRVTRIDHQFERPFPGYYPSVNGFLPTPQWPSDTTQFGFYYVRGPW